MAICNLFNRFTNASGNFMMFSQYVEDLTHTCVENDNYKVVPTKFIALDIDYKNIDYKKTGVIPNSDIELNIGIPQYFQNYFENGCAYGRKTLDKSWNSEISKNLFWNAMIDGGFITTRTSEDIEFANEIVYVGDINMHSHNVHKGMGYGEIYCYIPTDAKRMHIEIKNNFTTTREFVENENSYLEGYGPTDYVSFSDKISTIGIDNYSKKYYFNNDYSLAIDDQDLQVRYDNNTNKYNVNTLVVLYSIFNKRLAVDNSVTWEPIYENIPLGLYITGIFDENNDLTNNITKYVTTSYGTGTSYGLRICTRYSVSTSGAILNNSDIITDNSDYTNISQLMTAMGKNLSKMMEICKTVQNSANDYKDYLSIFKNNKTNVPYVREINGKSYWFVNGKLVSVISDSSDDCCNAVSIDVIKKRIENIMDGDDSNDYSYIEDPNGCDCNPLSNWDLVDAINKLDPDADLNPEDYPEFGGGTTGGNTPPKPGGTCNCNLEVADDLEVITELEKTKN